MRLAAAGVAEAPPVSDALARVRARVDLRALVARGWDPEARVFAPSADDALFGYRGLLSNGVKTAADASSNAR